MSEQDEDRPDEAEIDEALHEYRSWCKAQLALAELESAGVTPRANDYQWVDDKARELADTLGSLLERIAR